MLKQCYLLYIVLIPEAAAFGRLCVETLIPCDQLCTPNAAAFGRLCVETDEQNFFINAWKAAAFGRLCVETDVIMRLNAERIGSRLRAAVC